MPGNVLIAKSSFRNQRRAVSRIYSFFEDRSSIALLRTAVQSFFSGSCGMDIHHRRVMVFDFRGR